MKRGIKVLVSVIIALVALTIALSSLALANSRTSPLNSSSALPPARPHNPNSGVYTLYDSLTPGDVPTATFNWIEIRNSADYVWDLGGDFIEDGDVSSSFPIGFYFPFYDDFYTEFRISEKGYIFFEKSGVNVGPGDGLPAEIPADVGATPGDASNNFIAPFASDLFGYPGISRVYVRNDSNPRRTIIEFENVVWCCGQYNPRTLQIILHPGGAIETQYLKITNFSGTLDEDLNKIVRVGLENLDGSAGDVYTQGLFIPGATTFWQDGLAVRYERSLSDVTTTFIPDTQRIWDDPGRPITVAANLYLAAPENITRSFTVMTSSLDISSTVPKAEWENNITHTTFVPPISGTYTGTVQFVLTVPTNADLWDVATATFVAESVEPMLVSDTFTIVYGPAHRDLQIQKDLDPQIAPANTGAFRYRLTITNTDYNNSERAAIARSVVVTDLLPTNVTYEDCHRYPYYQDCGSSVVTDIIGGRTMVTWTVGAMEINEVRTIWLELRNNNSSGSVDNTAYITLTDGLEVGYPYRNSDDENFTVDTAKSELNVYKEYPYPFIDDQNYVAAGQVIPFDIYYYNDGRDGHIGNVPVSATLVDVIPENTIFDRATTGVAYNSPQITPDSISGPMSRTLTFNNVDVDNGWWNEDGIRIWVIVPITTPIDTLLTNTVAISDGISQDTDTEMVKVISNYVDPFIDKGPSVDLNGEIIMPEPGKDYTYWITYGNRSVLTDAIDYIISDTLPASVTLVSASPGRYLTGPFTSTVGGKTIISWYTPTLEAGIMDQLLIIVHVGSDVPQGTELANTIVMTYTGDFTPSTTMDDTDILTLEVASDINGSAKQVDNPNPTAGQVVEYTIVVSYTGGTPNTAFTVTDSLAPELIDVSLGAPSNGTASLNAGVISWNGNIDPNDQATLTFTAKITEAGQLGDVIWNTANIAIDGGSNVNRQVKVILAEGIFGGSSKTASPSTVAGGGQVNYTIVVANSGSASTPITVTDSLPLSITFPSSFNYSSGSVISSPVSRVFTWTTNVGVGSNENLSFQVTVTDAVTDGNTIENVAYLDTGSPPLIPLSATVTINSAATGDIYLPIILKQ